MVVGWCQKNEDQCHLRFDPKGVIRWELRWWLVGREARNGSDVELRFRSAHDWMTWVNFIVTSNCEWLKNPLEKVSRGRFFPLLFDVFDDTVDGSDILHQLRCALSHEGFIHPRWCRISAVNSIFPNWWTSIWPRTDVLKLHWIRWFLSQNSFFPNYPR